MALHSKWSSGDLIFYDGTQNVFTIQDDNEGLLIGEDGEGVDVKFFGDTTGAYILWDEDADALTFAGIDISLGDADYINFGAEPDITMRWTTGGVFEILPAAADTDIYLGSTTLPLDVKFFGSTGSSNYMQWQSTGNVLDIDGADIELGDDDYIKFGDTGELSMRWTTGKLEILPTVAGSDMYLGSTSKPLDVVNYGNITYRDPATTSSTGSTGTITLTTASNRVQFISTSTGGAREVYLPITTGSAGIEFKFVNTGATGAVTVKTTGGSATVATLPVGAMAITLCDGTNWGAIRGYGSTY